MTVLIESKKAKQKIFFTLLMALMVSSCNNSRPEKHLSDSTKTTVIHPSTMKDNTRMIDLFNRWEKVWHEEQYDLIPDCVGENYIRHDQKGDRTVTRDEYAAEIRLVHKARPGIRVVVYDHAFEGNRAWFRFAFKWTDPESGKPQSQAGFQSYRTEGGKLVETWLSMQPLGSVWPDKLAQEHWTSPSPGN